MTITLREIHKTAAQNPSIRLVPLEECTDRVTGVFHAASCESPLAVQVTDLGDGALLRMDCRTSATFEPEVVHHASPWISFLPLPVPARLRVGSDAVGVRLETVVYQDMDVEQIVHGVLAAGAAVLNTLHAILGAARFSLDTGMPMRQAIAEAMAALSQAVA